jgi:ribosomal protein S18 acetylase RimI-like enzyme
MKKIFLAIGLVSLFLSDATASVKVVNVKPRLNKGFMIKAYTKERDNLISPSAANTISAKSVVDDELKYNTVKMLLAHGKTTGFISYSKKGHVYAIYIAPQYRGKGYSKLLLDHAANNFRKRGLKKMDLDVFKHNHKALKAFKKAGFVGPKHKTSDILVHLSKKLS